jgi:hypothetical protein
MRGLNFLVSYLMYDGSIFLIWASIKSTVVLSMTANIKILQSPPKNSQIL